jgi:hypothetical protein
MGIFSNHLLHSRLFSEMRVCRGLVAACDESEIVALDRNPAKKKFEHSQYNGHDKI